jgi:hypothetical protein
LIVRGAQQSGALRLGSRHAIRPTLFALFSPILEAGRMAKIKISSTDLVWAFTEKLRSFDDCANVSIAVVPTADGWKAIASQKDMAAHPRCAKHVEQIQKQLREIYVLKK